MVASHLWARACSNCFTKSVNRGAPAGEGSDFSLLVKAIQDMDREVLRSGLQVDYSGIPLLPGPSGFHGVKHHAYEFLVSDPFFWDPVKTPVVPLVGAVARMVAGCHWSVRAVTRGDFERGDWPSLIRSLGYSSVEFWRYREPDKVLREVVAGKLAGEVVRVARDSVRNWREQKGDIRKDVAPIDLLWIPEASSL